MINIMPSAPIMNLENPVHSLRFKLQLQSDKNKYVTMQIINHLSKKSKYLPILFVLIFIYNFSFYKELLFT